MGRRRRREVDGTLETIQTRGYNRKPLPAPEELGQPFVIQFIGRCLTIFISSLAVSFSQLRVSFGFGHNLLNNIILLILTFPNQFLAL